MYKLTNNYFSTDLSFIYPFQSPYQRSPIQIIQASHKIAMSIQFLELLMMNNLPSHIVDVESLNSFKAIIDSYLSTFRFSFI